MILTKTQIKIMQIFTGQMTKSFTIRQVARLLDMHISLAHRAIKPLVEQQILELDAHRQLSINYKKNHGTLCYVEYQKSSGFLNKNKTLSLFIEDVTEKILEDCFILLLFGSAVISEKPRDIDILLIVDNVGKIEFHEKFLDNMASRSTLPIEAHVLSFESIYEMLAKHDEPNLMNEALDKHLVFHGAELFYRLIKRARL